MKLVRMHLLLLITAYVVLAPVQILAENRPLKVGVILPLSGSASFWGQNPRRGIELALKDAGERSHSVEFVFEDDGCQPKKAVSAFTQMVASQDVALVLGPVCSSSSLAVAPLAVKNQVPLLVFSEADAITKVGENIFRLWVPNGRQGILMAEHMFESGVRSLALLGITNDYGEAILGALKRRFQELGGKIVAQEWYRSENLDLRPELSRIKARKPDAVFVAAYIEDGITVLKRMRELQLKVKLYFSNTVHSPDFIESTGALSDGIVFADLQDSTASFFRERWKQEYNEAWPGLSSGGSIFYDITAALIDLASRGSFDMELLIKHLQKQHVVKKGVAGALRFDSEGSLSRKHALYRIHDSKVSPISKNVDHRKGN